MTDTAIGIEQLVAAAWREALRVPSLAGDADFYDLGGTSLQAIQIVSRLNDALGIDLPVGMFDRASTLADFAAAVADAVHRLHAS